MVRRAGKDGLVHHEPPYTKEEEEEFYRRVDAGPVTFTRPAAPPAKQGVAQPPEARTPSSKPR